jgi:uncharacterized protein YcfJ
MGDKKQTGSNSEVGAGAISGGVVGAIFGGPLGFVVGGVVGAVGAKIGGPVLETISEELGLGEIAKKAKAKVKLSDSADETDEE